MSDEQAPSVQLTLEQLQALIPPLRHFIVALYDEEDHLIEESVMAHTLGFSPSGALLFSVFEISEDQTDIKVYQRCGYGDWKKFWEVLAPSKMPKIPHGLVIH